MSPYLYVFLYFASISLAGVLIACMRTLKLKLPVWIGPVHGMAGLFGLAAFFLINLKFAPQAGNLVWWSLGVFSLGLIGGLIFFRVLFTRGAPIWIYAGHGSVAVLGLYLLYVPAFFAG